MTDIDKLKEQIKALTKRVENLEYFAVKKETKEVSHSQTT